MFTYAFSSNNIVEVQGLAMGPPQPFKLEDKPGKLEVTLRRSFGQEDIKLTAMFQPGMGVEGEEFEEDEELPEQNVSI